MIAARGVGVVRGGTRILSGIDVTFAAGEVAALIGPNGAGKSTLLGVLAGDVVPTAGVATIGGDDVARLPFAERARRRAVLPQAPGAVPPFVARDVVALGVSRHHPRFAPDAYLARVGLAALAGRAYAALSGGERQRVHLARVIAQLEHGARPGVLLLDEPTAALDPRHQHVVLDAIRAVARAGHAVIIVLHDLASVLACADRAVLLADGRITADAAPAAVIGSRASRDAYGVDLRVVATAGTHAVVALPFDRPSTPSVLERSPP